MDTLSPAELELMAQLFACWNRAYAEQAREILAQDADEPHAAAEAARAKRKNIALAHDFATTIDETQMFVEYDRRRTTGAAMESRVAELARRLRK